MVSLHGSSLSQRPLRTRYYHLRSSASAICSEMNSIGSTHQDRNWTTKFCSQRASHMEPSATSTTVTGPVRERLQTGTEDASFCSYRPAPLRRFHDSGAGYKYPYILTVLWEHYPTLFGELYRTTRNSAIAERPCDALCRWNITVTHCHSRLFKITPLSKPCVSSY